MLLDAPCELHANPSGSGGVGQRQLWHPAARTGAESAESALQKVFDSPLSRHAVPSSGYADRPTERRAGTVRPRGSVRGAAAARDIAAAGRALP